MTGPVLVFGAMGQVGTALQHAAPASTTVVAHDFRETDIRSENAVTATIDTVRPALIVNCAAFTNVDAAETQVAEAREVNAIAPGIIARAAAKAGVRFIHLSTDYVFDGCAHEPYVPSAPVGPLSVYGATKLEGERRAMDAAPDAVILRTAWLHSGGGANFVRTCVRHLGEGRSMRVVDDQIGTPTRAVHLARAIWRIAERPDIHGILHFTDAGVASWFDVALTVLESLGEEGRLANETTVSPISTAEYPTPARRPMYSVLDKHDCWRLIDYTPPHWRAGVRASISELLNA